MNGISDSRSHCPQVNLWKLEKAKKADKELLRHRNVHFFHDKEEISKTETNLLDKVLEHV